MRCTERFAPARRRPASPYPYYALDQLERVAQHPPVADALSRPRDIADLAVTRYPHFPLSERIWQLRHNLSAYDSTFVALAEALGVTLVTCDTHFAGSPGHGAQIELLPAR